MDQAIGVVLLNFNGFEDTINCIKSIENQVGIKIEICVVDNASINESVEKISKYITENIFKHKITLIENKKNEGFARGNNVGIKYLRSQGIEFIFVLNNDTLMTENDSLKKLIDSYRPGVGVINPACVGFNGEFQEPYRLSQGNMIKDYCQALALTGWQVFKAIFNVDYSIHKHTNKAFVPDEYKYIIQGNAYILTPDYFREYKQLFPKTFLYFEELYLLWYLQKANLTTVYCENIVIKHKEAGSDKKISHYYKLKKAKCMVASVVRGFVLLPKNKDQINRCYN